MFRSLLYILFLAFCSNYLLATFDQDALEFRDAVFQGNDNALRHAWHGLMIHPDRNKKRLQHTLRLGYFAALQGGHTAIFVKLVKCYEQMQGSSLVLADLIEMLRPAAYAMTEVSRRLH